MSKTCDDKNGPMKLSTSIVKRCSGHIGLLLSKLLERGTPMYIKKKT